MRQLNSKFYKRFIFVMMLVFVYSGCCKSYLAPIVIIRGKELRTSKFELPLNSKSKLRLIEYLKRDGDWQKDPNSPSFYQKDFYAKIILLLEKSDDEKIKMSNLCKKNEKRLWVVIESNRSLFKLKHPIFGVFNSSLDRNNISSYKPFSLYDGNLWWVFYPYENDLNSIQYVRVTVPISGSVKRMWDE